MGEKIRKLHTMYENFKNGKEDALAVRDHVLLALEEEKSRGNSVFQEELEDILMDLEFSIEDDKCKCHKSSSIS